MDHVRDHSPKMRFVFFVQGNGGVVGVFGQEPGLAFCPVKAFDCKLAVDGNDDHFAIGCLDAPVHYEQVAVVNSGVDHGISPGPDKKGGSRFTYEVGVQIESTLQVIVSGGWKTGGYSTCVQGQSIFPPLHKAKDALDLAFRNADGPGRLAISIASLGASRPFSSASSYTHLFENCYIIQKGQAKERKF